MFLATCPPKACRPHANSISRKQHRELRLVVDIELHVDTAEVVADSRRRNIEFACHLLVAAAPAEKTCDLEFTRAQLIDFRSLARANRDELPTDARVESNELAAVVAHLTTQQLGHIVNANGLTVTVEDSPDSSEGVVITVGAGVGAARVSVCGFSLQVSAGSSIVATCGSITLKVNEGVARVLLNAAETSYVEVAQDAVAKVELQATDGTFAVQNLGETRIAVVTNNVVTPVAPGEHASAGTLFTGFSSPVDVNDVQNRVKAGSTVALKWRLTNAIDGSPVTNLSSASVTAANLTCDLGVTSDLIEEASAGGAGLQNLGNGFYQFNWKTPKTYANSCKTLTMTLGGGVVPTQSALFSFVK